MKSPDGESQSEQTIAPPLDAAAAAGQTQLQWLSTIGKRTFREYQVECAMLGVLIVLSIVVDVLYPELLSGADLSNIFTLMASLFLIAVGQLIVLITGGIDLSVGSIFAFSSVEFALLANSHGIAIGVIGGLGVGAGVGVVNGFLVAVLGLAPFIVTLASYAAAASLALVVTNGMTQTVPDSASAFSLGHAIPGVPNYLLLIIVTLISGHVITRWTRVGRFYYAVGSNVNAAALVGVPVRSVKFSAYVLSGVLAALAGIFVVTGLFSADATAGTTYLLESIAAVVIGGASLAGGVGSIIGALIGTAIIVELQNGLVVANVPAFWQGTTYGLVIILAIMVERLLRTGRRRQ